MRAAGEEVTRVVIENGRIIIETKKASHIDEEIMDQPNPWDGVTS